MHAKLPHIPIHKKCDLIFCNNLPLLKSFPILTLPCPSLYYDMKNSPIMGMVSTHFRHKKIPIDFFSKME